MGVGRGLARPRPPGHAPVHAAARRLALAAVLSLVFAAAAQTPTVQPRLPAMFGASDKDIVEPAIASNGCIAIAIAPSVLSGIRYNIYDASAGSWSPVLEGVIPDSVGKYGDVSIVADNNGDFLACSLGNYEDGKIFVNKYDYVSPTQGSWESSWRQIYEAPVLCNPVAVDIPWLVAGEVTPFGQEYYMFAWGWCEDDFAYVYRRSTDGGVTWNGGLVNIGGVNITGLWICKPTVAADGTVYCAFNDAITSKIRVFKGTDSANGGMTFDWLYEPLDPLEWTPQTVKIRVETAQGQVDNKLPGFIGGGRVPCLVADPTDAHRLFLCYHDTPASSSSDVDIYLRVLTADEHWKWTVGGLLQVNQDEIQGEQDQAYPSLAIDASGNLHVIFYDDRDYVQNDGLTGLERYDVYYAFGDYNLQTGLVDWAEWELCANPDNCDPNDASFDGTTNGSSGDVDIREYIGICAYGDYVFTAFTGQNNEDTQSNKSLIFSSLIIME